MSPEAREQWLRRRLRHDATVCLLLGPVAVVGGLVVLFLTFWFAYALTWMVGWVGGSLVELLGSFRWRPDHQQCLWGATGFTGLLVFTHLRGDGRPADLGDFSGENPAMLGRTLAGMAHESPGSRLLLHPGHGARMIVDILLTGPRLVQGGVRLLREGVAKFSADSGPGARLLGTLQGAAGKVPYADLNTIHDAIELRAGMLTLRGITGVVFLEQGLTLTDELRTELAAGSGAAAHE